VAQREKIWGRNSRLADKVPVFFGHLTFQLLQIRGDLLLDVKLKQGRRRSTMVLKEPAAEWLPACGGSPWRRPPAPKGSAAQLSFFRLSAAAAFHRRIWNLSER